MIVLKGTEEEQILIKIAKGDIPQELGNEKYIQRVIAIKRGYRICILYTENKRGFKTKVRLAGGEKLTVRGPYLVVHDEYGVYKNISMDDVGLFLLAEED